jgi:hypothetical protein
MKNGAAAPASKGGKQMVLAHDPQHPLAAGADAIPDPQPGPDLAMALALEG